MEMKRGLFLGFLGLVCGLSWAQEITIGPDNSIKNSEVLTQIIGEKDSIIYIQKSQTSVFKSDGEYLERFDSRSLESLGSIPLLLNNAYIEHRGRRLEPQFEDVFFYQNRIILCLSAHDRKQKELLAYAAIFDKNDRQVYLILLDQLKNASSYDPGRFIFWPNASGNKLFVFQMTPSSKKEMALYGIKVFNSNWEKEWQKGFLLPYKRNDTEIINVLSDASGNIAMLIKVSKPRKEVKFGGNPYSYHLISYLAGSEDVVAHSISIPNKKITDIQILLNHKDKIIVSGFLCPEGNSGITGAFYGCYAFDGSVEMELRYSNFTQEILEQFLKERSIMRGDGLSGFSIDRIFLREKGGVYVISEQFLIQEICNRDARGILTCNYYYYYNSIVVNAISEEGKFEWNAIIPKYQSSVNDNGWFSSYAVAQKGDTLYFLYNEHAKNFDQDDPEKYRSMIRPGKAKLAMSKLSPDGKIEKTALVSSKTGNNIIRPRFYHYDSKGDLIIPAFSMQSNNFRLIKIAF